MEKNFVKKFLGGNRFSSNEEAIKFDQVYLFYGRFIGKNQDFYQYNICFHFSSVKFLNNSRKKFITSIILFSQTRIEFNYKNFNVKFIKLIYYMYIIHIVFIYFY